MKDSKETVNEIQALISKNTDAYKGFRKAAENSDRHELKSYLIDQAEARKEYAERLKKDLTEFDPEVKIDDEGTFSESLHRTWINVKSVFGGMDDQAILEECIRSDKIILEEYRNYLSGPSTASPQIATTLHQQYQQMIQNLDNLVRLKEIK